MISKLLWHGNSENSAPIGALELDMIWGYFLAIQIAKVEFYRVTDVREDNAFCSVARIG